MNCRSNQQIQKLDLYPYSRNPWQWLGVLLMGSGGTRNSPGRGGVLWNSLSSYLILSTMPLPSYQMNHLTLIWFQFGCYRTALYLIFYILLLFGLVDIIIRFDSCLALLEVNAGSEGGEHFQRSMPLLRGFTVKTVTPFQPWRDSQDHWILGGHLNWLFNVLPWGRPAIQELYWKTSGKQRNYSQIFLNSTVISDLTQLASIIPNAISVRFVDTGRWNNLATNMVLWTDASGKLGLSFVYTRNSFIYPLKPKQGCLIVDIFFLKMVAILSAIHHVANFSRPPRQVLIYTDSLNSVAVFNTLSTSQPFHNSVLLRVAEIILRSGLDLHIQHIEGKKNIWANLLSRLLVDDYHLKFPADRVCMFEHLCELLLAWWRESF